MSISATVRALEQREAQRQVDRGLAADPPVVVEHVARQAELGSRQEADDVRRRSGDRQAEAGILRRRPVQPGEVDRGARRAQAHGGAARHVEMQRAALVARLARDALQLGHVRHVAHGHAAIVDQADQAIDLDLRQVVAGRAQRELGGDVDLAVAEIGQRPSPAARRELERPVVAQAIDRDAQHLGAAGEHLAFRRLRPGAGDQYLGGAEIDVDALDLDRMRRRIHRGAGVHRLDLVRRRQHAGQRHPAVAAGDVDGDVAHIALAVAVDVQPARQRDVEAAQQHRIGRQVGEHRGLEAVDIGIDREPAAVARIDAGQGDVDRIAAAAETRIGRNADARRVALELAARRRGDPGDARLGVAQRELRLLDADRVELADQRLVVGLVQQLFDQDRHRLALRLRARIREDAAQHAAFAIDLRFDGRPLDGDRGRQQHALEDAARIEGERGLGRRGDHLVLAIGEAQPGEDQPYRLAEPAPFQGNAVGIGRDVVARHIGRLRRSAPSGSRGRRGRPSGEARPPPRARPGRGQRRPLRARIPDKFA